jgi:hypothetical protein
MPKTRRPWTVVPHGALEKIDENLWTVCSAIPGAPGSSRRMCIVKRSDGDLLFFHAIPLEDVALAEVLAWGRPAQLVVGHDLHAIDAHGFREKLGVRVYGPKQRAQQLRQRVEPAFVLHSLAGMRTGEPAVVVKSGGGRRVNVLFCDAIMNIPRESASLFLRLGGFVGGAKVPPLTKILFVNNKRALRNHLAQLADLPYLERLVPCHGDIVEQDAARTLRAAAAKL